MRIKEKRMGNPEYNKVFLRPILSTTVAAITSPNMSPTGAAMVINDASSLEISKGYSGD